MSRSHNKKRNVGIIYEQLITDVSTALVEKNQKRAAKSVHLIKKHFGKGTELYKEFRLFNAMLKTTVKSDALASRIVSESKVAALSHDYQKLNQEKSDLIREINYSYGKDFYKTPVKNYKMLATIQSLLNDWRNPKFDVQQRVTYESKIHEWLLTEKFDTDLETLKTPDVNDLTVKIMRETFNKKFGDVLNDSQKSLLKCLVFEGELSESSKQEVVDLMTEQRQSALKLMKEYERQCESAHVKEKIPKAIKLLESLDVNDVSDQNIAKCLTVTRLCDELLEK